MILSDVTLEELNQRLVVTRKSGLITPWIPCKKVANGMSYGLTHGGYDIRIREEITLYPITLKNLFLKSLGFKRPSFSLASTIEYFDIPTNLQPELMDKSSWARKGLSIQNTVFEPGFKGFITLELFNQGDDIIHIPANAPIGQVIFRKMTTPAKKGYDGKYQNQGQGPQESRFEK